MWIDVDVAFDTFLSHVSPGVATHPLPLTLRALVLSKASLLPLVGCQSFTFGSGLRAVFDIVALVEAQVAQVVGWGSFVRFSCFRREGKV